MQPGDKQQHHAGELGHRPDHVIDRPLPGGGGLGKQRHPLTVDGNGNEVSQQIRADDRPGQQFADDAGHFDALGQPAQELGRAEDGRDLEDDEHHLIGAGMLAQAGEFGKVGGKTDRPRGRPNRPPGQQQHRGHRAQNQSAAMEWKMLY